MRVFCDTGMQVVGWHSYSRLTQSVSRLAVDSGLSLHYNSVAENDTTTAAESHLQRSLSMFRVSRIDSARADIH